MKEVARNILLNPGPATTTDTVKNALVVPDICPREREFMEVVEQVAHDLILVANGGKDYLSVLFAGSGTAAVEACISSVVPEGKAILVLDNGAYGQRMTDIARCYGIEVIACELAPGAYPDLEGVEALLREHQGRISHFAVVHHETSTGMLNPLPELLLLARSYGVELIVDAMSSFGGIPINLQETDYDYLIASSNKNLQGMAGVSFVIMKKELLEKIETVKQRSYYLSLSQQQAFFSQNGQMQFTPPVQVIYALRQALHEYFEEGGDARHARYAKNWETLVSGLRDIGFRLLLPEAQHAKLLTAVLEPSDPQYAFEPMHDYCYTRGFTLYPGKSTHPPTFRIANIGAIHPEDIQAFLTLIRGYVETRDIRQF